MTLQQLEYVIALDDHRHYVTAAEHSYVSQPNLTMQVKKFEEELGVRIFDRDSKPLRPTKIGREVINRARQIIRESKQLKEFVSHEIESMEGEFRVGIIPTLAPYLLPRFLPAFVKDNPRVHLNIQELQTRQIISQLENGSIDLGIIVTPIEQAAIREIPVFYEPFLLYLPERHRFLKKKLLLPEDLDPKEILILNEGHCFRDQALSICESAMSESSIGFDYQSGSIEALKNLVKNGIGYTLVPELSTMQDADTPNTRRFDDPQPVREVSIVVHSSFIKEAIIDSLRSAMIKAVPTKFLTKQAVVHFDLS